MEKSKFPKRKSPVLKEIHTEENAESELSSSFSPFCLATYTLSKGIQWIQEKSGKSKLEATSHGFREQGLGSPQKV